jgi:hypothetical protein
MIATATGLPLTGGARYDPPFPLEGRAGEHLDPPPADLRAALAQNRPARGPRTLPDPGRGPPHPRPSPRSVRGRSGPRGRRAPPNTTRSSSPPTPPQRVLAPALVITGSPQHHPCSPSAAKTRAGRRPEGTLRVLQGQTHAIDPEAVGPVITQFLTPARAATEGTAHQGLSGAEGAPAAPASAGARCGGVRWCAARRPRPPQASHLGPASRPVAAVASSAWSGRATALTTACDPGGRQPPPRPPGPRAGAGGGASGAISSPRRSSPVRGCLRVAMPAGSPPGQFRHPGGG